MHGQVRLETGDPGEGSLTGRALVRVVGGRGVDGAMQEEVAFYVERLAALLALVRLDNMARINQSVASSNARAFFHKE